jgi:hypothetical protein
MAEAPRRFPRPWRAEPIPGGHAADPTVPTDQAQEAIKRAIRAAPGWGVYNLYHDTNPTYTLRRLKRDHRLGACDGPVFSPEPRRELGRHGTEAG